MTNVITVSAATAAYATEPLKASARVSGSAPVQETMHALSLETRKADTIRHQELMNTVGPGALALFFLTTGEQNRRLPQTTLHEAQEAYYDNLQQEAVDPDADGERRDDETSDDDASADEDLGQEQHELLALPAPETFS